MQQLGQKDEAHGHRVGQLGAHEEAEEQHLGTQPVHVHGTEYIKVYRHDELDHYGRHQEVPLLNAHM